LHPTTHSRTLPGSHLPHGSPRSSTSPRSNVHPGCHSDAAAAVAASTAHACSTSSRYRAGSLSPLAGRSWHPPARAEPGELAMVARSAGVDKGIDSGFAVPGRHFAPRRSLRSSAIVPGVSRTRSLALARYGRRTALPLPPGRNAARSRHGSEAGKGWSRRVLLFRRPGSSSHEGLSGGVVHEAAGDSADTTIETPRKIQGRQEGENHCRGRIAPGHS